MNYKLLGSTGIKVSEFCFGTMLFGGSADEAASAQLYETCRDAGINFFDCANVYEGGKSETILGKLMSGHRDEIILTSKFYFPQRQDINGRGGSRLNIKHSIEGSLKRLNTDYIDLYFIHNFDPNTPLEVTLRTLDDLVSQGKILHPAVSNFAAWQIMKALGISERNSWAKFAAIQPMYNLAKRQAEVELLPMAESEGLAVIPYNPLGGGLLAGKYGRSRRPGTGRLLENKMYMTRYGAEENYDIAERFTDFAKERGFDPASLAVAWVKAHQAVTAPILGARNVEQLKGSLGALDIDMTPELYQEISDLSPQPPPPTDRVEERSEFKF
ncbi:MAG: aldo/keto reductase [Chloroflexota bacterium]